MPRAKQRTPELRDRVLASALELLARDGVGAFTTRGLARAADTSTPAVYELFGDKAGLVREVFFAGFRLLRDRLASLEQSEDPLADLLALGDGYRAFIRENPVLAEVMFSRPFGDFDPSEAERRAGADVRELIVARVRRCVRDGVLAGDELDIAHVLVALMQGLALADNAHRLGRSRRSVERRWDLAIRALLDGLRVPPS
ncbi:MAG TPA: TetR/AcrR family transcriptional regulator [Solirubrobacteraceae bacterium]|nr:TetR/AcrR family transcriptional regulator [Solirubrobacteraceae bacterium]